MIWAGCFKKLFEVIGGLPCLVLRIALRGNDELLVEVASVLVVIALVAVGHDRDSLWSPLRPPLVACSTLLAPVSVALVCALRLPLGTSLVLLYMKIAPTASSPEACLVAISRSSFVVFG
jgi:hypothetical protein